MNKNVQLILQLFQEEKWAMWLITFFTLIKTIVLTYWDRHDNVLPVMTLSNPWNLEIVLYVTKDILKLILYYRSDIGKLASIS